MRSLKDKNGRLATLENLTEPAKKLAIGMCHFSQSGDRLDVIEVTTDIAGPKLKKALEELRQRGMVQKGVWEVVGYTTLEETLAKYPNFQKDKFIPQAIHQFRQDNEGDRYRLDEAAKTGILKAIFPPDGVPKYK